MSWCQGLTIALCLAPALTLARSLPARAGGLSPVEQRVAAYVDAHGGEAVALLEKVVNIPSATENRAGVREVGKVFAAEFERAGLTARWEDMPAAMKRAGHLIAEHEGTRGKRLLLIGHLDTVLEGRKFERVDGGPVKKATGTGTIDMKGGDVVLLYALKALKEAGALDGCRVTVILTGDEEDAGAPFATSRGSMLALARRSDVALAFEASIDDTATIARRGVGSWTLRVKGRTGHSSGILGPHGGAGAVFEAARIVDEFRRELAGRKGLTCNPSLFVGGTEAGLIEGVGRGTAGGKRNVIAGEAVVEGDIRFLSNDQLKAAEETMRAVVARNLPKTSAEIEFVGEYPAMAPTAGNLAVLAVLAGASRDLGLGPVKPHDPVQRGAGDIAFVAHLVDGLDGLGPTGARSHAPDEWVDLDTIPAQIKRAAVLMHRLTRD